MATGLIFDIQGHSVHDGPGCRTVVFLSGCPLRCSWCANPEGQQLRPRVMYRAARCRGCRRCEEACPHRALYFTADPELPVKFDQAWCEQCAQLDCAKQCRNEALIVSGKWYAAAELMRILTRDQSFWGAEGGVTFSGGEPLGQAPFLLEMLQRCRAAYMHTVVETAGYAATETLLELLPWIDWLLLDLKLVDADAHRTHTGAANDLILKNIAAVAATSWEGRLVLRSTIVPGVNDSAQSLSQLADFMQQHRLRELNLLPFHRLGQSKYRQLGLSYPYAATPSPSAADLRQCRQLLAGRGLTCYLDYETPF